MLRYAINFKPGDLVKVSGSLIESRMFVTVHGLTYDGNGLRSLHKVPIGAVGYAISEATDIGYVDMHYQVCLPEIGTILYLSEKVLERLEK